MEKKEEKKFEEIVDFLRRRNELDILLDIIPDKTKKEFLQEWKE
jgi:hypothetical protein